MGDQETKVSRRGIFELGSAAFTAAAAITVAMPGQAGASPQNEQAQNRNASNETDPGPRNLPLAKENPDSVWPPTTDNGSVKPFKYSFALSRKRIEKGGWTRQVTVRDLAISKDIAGVEMRLTAGGVRELHWHVEAEWAIMLYGNARITAVDHEARSFVEDVNEGDLWLFPPGVPHSIQGLGPDGCRFLLVFDDGNFDEFHTFLITDWLAHTPKDVLAKNFNVPASTFDKVPKKELFIFQAELPGPLNAEQAQASAGTGTVPKSFAFRPKTMKPTKVTPGGEVKIIDSKTFPVSPIAAAIVTLKPGGLRELHWHPNADEWQYYIQGKGRMTLFIAGSDARTMDFQEGDVGYVPISNPHYIENTGDTDLVFLEMFKSREYQDISLGEWMAHTPHLLMDQHLKVGMSMLDAIPKQESVITPV
ncbi:MAG TPA: cupin domain-containing protein [Bryobacteraceae bacterium]|jgi:oxalate decarboxylase|nr:cupin domain-containing protein [Bryobacteraceae bacterium]